MNKVHWFRAKDRLRALGKLTEEEKNEQVFVYERTFLWDPTFQRWVLQKTTSTWMAYIWAFACGEIGVYEQGKCAPPYFVGERWIWRRGKWESDPQRESNWPQGPHTCFGPC
jgi:hypothetical protein